MSAKSYVMLLLPLFLVILFHCRIVQAGIELEYTIEVRVDGSATWTAEQKGTEIPAPLAVYDTFVKNVSLLVSTAENETGRDMSVEYKRMTVSPLGSYKIVTYEFRWIGFADVEAGRITIGDVFRVKNFFSYLYGDGAVSIVYPSEYTVESVSPEPKWKNSSQTLEWYGIEDFGIGKPKVVFTQKSSFSVFMDIIGKNAVLIFSLLALISGGSVSLYYFKFRRNIVKEGARPSMHEFPSVLGIEDDEEKVVNLLRAAGGSLYQSTITDRCEFSRSKTSKLLKTMEDKGKIRREERGRQKIVTLLESRGEK